MRTTLAIIYKLGALACAIMCGRAAGYGGNIVGTVRAAEPPAPAGAVENGNYSSHRYKFVEKVDYDHLTDFVVYLDGPAGAGAIPSQPQAVTTQKDANFAPHVLPVAVGTTVRWPNEDDLYHNVFSMSETKEFDLGYYKKDRIPEIVFDHVGRVDVFCAIHKRMHCIILVVPNIYFASADAKGRFAINNVPAGTYAIRAWHERLPGQTQKITVPAQGEVRVEFVLKISELPKL